MNQSRSKGNGWSTANKYKHAPPPSHTHLSNFIAGHPKVDLLFWVFGDFSCAVSYSNSCYILSNNRNLTVVNLSMFLEHQQF